MELPFRIGKLDTTLVPVATNAPARYDGFGTIELRADYPYIAGMEVPGGRLVLVRKEHLAWQTGRYRSGAYAADPEPEKDNPGIDEGNLTQDLLARLCRE